jgi:hypothetical protein
MNYKETPVFVKTLVYPAIAVVLGLTVLGVVTVVSGFSGSLTFEMYPDGGRLEIQGR